MIWLAIAILSLLAFFNYRVGQRAALFPPFVFCAMWAANLLLVACAGNFFYPLHTVSVFIFICGAIAFTAGSWLALWLPAKPIAQQPISPASNRIVNWLLFAVVIDAFFFYGWWKGLIGSMDQSGLSFLSLAKTTTMDLAKNSSALWVFILFAELSRIIDHGCASIPEGGALTHQ